MAEFTWGDMPKNQIDPQLITEAISQAIAVHEADPESHLGSGESLQSHKASVIIDHVAGSVLADKITMSEVDVYTDFGSLMGWVTTGDFDNGYWPGIRLGSDYPSASGTKIIAEEGFCENVFNLSKDFIIEYAGLISDSITSTQFVGLSNADYPVSGNTMVGFKIINNVCKFVFGKGAFFHLSPVVTVDLSTPHVYRAQYNAQFKVIQFFLDGVLVEQVDLSSLSGSVICYFRLNLKESAENLVTSFIYYFRASRQA